MFLVPVRNEHTGEVRVVEIASAYAADAQIEALYQVFRESRWNKATALLPERGLEAVG